jgi:MFS transporter, DHA1 family, solute carrier family 18 (vesicular amine transporter), member 1/2
VPRILRYGGIVDASRRITLAVGLSMFVDASLYLSVIPLLPDYAERFDLSTLQAGLVIAAYPISVPIVSLGCIALVPRLGAKRITLVSAALMATSTVIFAWAPNVFVLLLARFVQGFASGSIWTASMAWVTDNAPAGRRGRESGIVMGMLSAGSVAGPAVGALASWTGQGPAFGLVAVVSIIGVVMTASAPAGRDVAHQSAIRAGLLRVARQPATRAALALSTADLLVFGAVDVLVPLRLGDEGTAVAVIAAALAAGAMLGAVTGPLAGRAVDRYGPSVVGSTAQAVMLLIPVALAFDPPSAVQLATLVIGGPLFATIGASIFPLSSMGADAAGVSHVTATGLLGAVWATGFTVVPVLAGAVAQAASASTAYVVVLLLCIAPLVVVVRSRPALGGAFAG